MTQSVRKRNKISDVNRLTRVNPAAAGVMYTVVGLFAAACIIPFLFVIIISFSSESSINTIGYSFFPQALTVSAYQAVWQIGHQLWISLFNSVFVTVVGTVLSVLICILYSYALFRQDYKYRRFFTFFSFFTMIFGGGLAPTVIVCRNLLGMHDNYFALIVPLLVSPFNFIIMRSFFQSSVPDALIEAASIDGSGEWRTLFQIIIPISKPGIATIALLNMLGYWNEWFLAQLYLESDSKLIPLQYLLVRMQQNAQYLAQNAAKAGLVGVHLPTEALQMAVCVVIVIPIAFAYPFFQRYIISGLTVGSVKG